LFDTLGLLLPTDVSVKMLVQPPKKPKEYVTPYAHDNMCRNMIQSISDQLSILMLGNFMPIDMIFSELNRFHTMLQSVFFSEVSDGVKVAATYQINRLNKFYEECKNVYMDQTSM